METDLNTKYNLDSLFLYHPFYPYPVTSSKTQKEKKGAVSISRISFEKNIDIIIKANNLLRQEDQIKLYGSASRMYVHLFLGGYDGDFNKYYCGIFDKSFSIFIILCLSLPWLYLVVDHREKKTDLQKPSQRTLRY